MAKKKRTKKTSPRSLFDDAEKILQDLRFGRGHVMIVLIIPSHDRNNKAIKGQPNWVDEGMQLLGKLYGGATAFQARKGIFISEKKQPIYDEPFLLESYAELEAVEDESNLLELLRFIKKIGRDTDQEAMGVVIEDTLHFITDYKE